MREWFHPEDWLVVLLVVWGVTILLIAIIVVVNMMN
jgi:hypothetical protein